MPRVYTARNSIPHPPFIEGRKSGTDIELAECHNDTLYQSGIQLYVTPTHSSFGEWYGDRRCCFLIATCVCSGFQYIIQGYLGKVAMHYLFTIRNSFKKQKQCTEVQHLLTSIYIAIDLWRVRKGDLSLLIGLNSSLYARTWARGLGGRSSPDFILILLHDN